MHEWQLLMVQVPNVPDLIGARGRLRCENKEVRTWGENQSFAFTPKEPCRLDAST
jgi:seryl-tRNA synthetase